MRKLTKKDFKWVHHKDSVIHEKKAYYGVGILQREITATILCLGDSSYIATVNNNGNKITNYRCGSLTQAKLWATKEFNKIIERLS